MTNQPASRTVFVEKGNPESDWIITENAHEPLVSAEVFEKAQNVRKARSHVGGQGRSTNRSLLSGLMVCRNCGYNFYQKFQSYIPKDGNRIRFYVDAGYNRKGKTVCQPISLPADALDRWVVGKVRDVVLGKAKTVAVAVDVFVNRVLKKRRPADDVAAIEKELAGVRTRHTPAHASRPNPYTRAAVPPKIFASLNRLQC